MILCTYENNKKEYRITYFDPTRWVYDEYIERTKTLREAKKKAKEMLDEYPTTYSAAFIAIEKIELIEMKRLGEKS